jgi:methyl-accepting chemotaxis protein
LSNRRNTVAEQVLAQTQIMVENGMTATLEVAQDAAVGVVLIGVLLVTGFGIAAILGITRSVMKPISESMQMAKAIVDGDFSQSIDIAQRDEVGQLAQALQNMKTRISDVLTQTNALTKSVQEGTLTARGDLHRFTGGWRTLVEGINDLIEAFVKPINVTADYIERLSKHDIPEEITEQYQGDFNRIKANLNLLGSDIRNVLQEVNSLNQSIQAGNLEARGNSRNFGGGWQKLVTGVNNVIEAFLQPLNVTTKALDRLAKGDIPGKITEVYQGDFNQIKNNLNAPN